VINSGYMSSWKAIDTARKIPNATKREYLNSKNEQKREDK